MKDINNETLALIDKVGKRLQNRISINIKRLKDNSGTINANQGIKVNDKRKLHKIIHNIRKK